jgi:hypothetical protein
MIHKFRCKTERRGALHKICARSPTQLAGSAKFCNALFRSVDAEVASDDFKAGGAAPSFRLLEACRLNI